MEIREFLHERLKDDEAVARAAAVRESRYPGDQWEVGSTVRREDYAFVSICTPLPEVVEIAGAGFDGTGGVRCERFAVHIARWDPARVLAEVKAKRAILDRHLPERAGYFDPKAKTGVSFVACEVDGNGGTTDDAWPCDELKHLAAPYAGHADFDPAWRVEA